MTLDEEELDNTEQGKTEEDEDVDKKLVYEGPRNFSNVVFLFKPDEECPNEEKLEKIIEKFVSDKKDVLVHCLTGGNYKKEGRYPTEELRRLTRSLKRAYVFHGWYVERVEPGEPGDMEESEYFKKVLQEEKKTLKRMRGVLDASDTPLHIWVSNGMKKG